MNNKIEVVIIVIIIYLMVCFHFDFLTTLCKDGLLKKLISSPFFVHVYHSWYASLYIFSNFFLALYKFVLIELTLISNRLEISSYVMPNWYFNNNSSWKNGFNCESAWLSSLILSFSRKIASGRSCISAFISSSYNSNWIFPCFLHWS